MADINLDTIVNLFLTPELGNEKEFQGETNKLIGTLLNNLDLPGAAIKIPTELEAPALSSADREKFLKQLQEQIDKLDEGMSTILSNAGTSQAARNKAKGEAAGHAGAKAYLEGVQAAMLKIKAFPASDKTKKDFEKLLADPSYLDTILRDKKGGQKRLEALRVYKESMQGSLVELENIRRLVDKGGKTFAGSGDSFAVVKNLKAVLPDFGAVYQSVSSQIAMVDKLTNAANVLATKQKNSKKALKDAAAEAYASRELAKVNNKPEGSDKFNYKQVLEDLNNQSRVLKGKIDEARINKQSPDSFIQLREGIDKQISDLRSARGKARGNSLAQSFDEKSEYAAYHLEQVRDLLLPGIKAHELPLHQQKDLGRNLGSALTYAESAKKIVGENTPQMTLINKQLAEINALRAQLNAEKEAQKKLEDAQKEYDRVHSTETKRIVNIPEAEALAYAQQAKLDKEAQKKLEDAQKERYTQSTTAEQLSANLEHINSGRNSYTQAQGNVDTLAPHELAPTQAYLQERTRRGGEIARERGNQWMQHNAAMSRGDSYAAAQHLLVIDALNEAYRTEVQRLNQVNQAIAGHISASARATTAAQNERAAQELLAEQLAARQAQIVAGQTAYQRVNGNVLQLEPHEQEPVRNYLQERTRRGGLIDQERGNQEALRYAAEQQGNAQAAAQHLAAVNALNTAHRTETSALSTVNRELSGHVGLLHQAVLAAQQFLRYAILYGSGFKALQGISTNLSGALDLDKQLHAIKAITQGSAEGMAAIEAAIKHVSSTTQFSTQEISQAAKVLAQAGVELDKLPGILSVSAKLAATTGAEIADATDVLTSLADVFERTSTTEVHGLADQIAQAVNISKLTTEGMKTIISLGASTAKISGLKPEQFFGAAATLSNKGVKDSTIATGLRQTMLELFNPDDKMLAYLKQRYESLGEIVSTAFIKARFHAFQHTDNPMMGTLTELTRVGVSGAGRDDFNRVTDIRAQNILLPLLDSLKDLSQNISKVAQSGAIDQGNATQMGAFNNALSGFSSTLTSLTHEIISGLLPALTSGATHLKDFAEYLRQITVSAEGNRISAAIHALGTGLAAGSVAAAKAPGGWLGKSAAFATTALGVGYADTKVRSEGPAGSAIADTAELGLSAVGAGLALKKLWPAVQAFFGTAGVFRNVSGIVAGLTAAAGALTSPVWLAITGAVVALAGAAYEVYDVLLRDKDAQRREQDKASMLAARARKANAQEQKDQTDAEFAPFDEATKGGQAETIDKLGKDYREAFAKADKLLNKGSEKGIPSDIVNQLMGLGSKGLEAGQKPQQDILKTIGKQFAVTDVKGLTDASAALVASQNALISKAQQQIEDIHSAFESVNPTEVQRAMKAYYLSLGEGERQILLHANQAKSSGDIQRLQIELTKLMEGVHNFKSKETKEAKESNENMAKAFLHGAEGSNEALTEAVLRLQLDASTGAVDFLKEVSKQIKEAFAQGRDNKALEKLGPATRQAIAEADAVNAKKIQEAADAEKARQEQNAREKEIQDRRDKHDTAVKEATNEEVVRGVISDQYQGDAQRNIKRLDRTQDLEGANKLAKSASVDKESQADLHIKTQLAEFERKLLVTPAPWVRDDKDISRIQKESNPLKRAEMYGQPSVLEKFRANSNATILDGLDTSLKGLTEAITAKKNIVSDGQATTEEYGHRITLKGLDDKEAIIAAQLEEIKYKIDTAKLSNTFKTVGSALAEERFQKQVELLDIRTHKMAENKVPLVDRNTYRLSEGRAAEQERSKLLADVAHVSFTSEKSELTRILKQIDREMASHVEAGNPAGVFELQKKRTDTAKRLLDAEVRLLENTKGELADDEKRQLIEETQNAIQLKATHDISASLNNQAEHYQQQYHQLVKESLLGNEQAAFNKAIGIEPTRAQQLPALQNNLEAAKQEKINLLGVLAQQERALAEAQRTQHDQATYDKGSLQVKVTNIKEIPVAAASEIPAIKDNPTAPATPKGLDNGLLKKAIMMQESGGHDYDKYGNPLLGTDSAKSRGAMQVTEETAHKPGFGIQPVRNNSVEEYDRVGTEYINKLVEKFAGDLPKVLAAYNSGPHTVDEAVAKGGKNWQKYIPADTRNKYIPQVMARLATYQNDGSQNVYVTNLGNGVVSSKTPSHREDQTPIKVQDVVKPGSLASPASKAPTDAELTFTAGISKTKAAIQEIETAIGTFEGEILNRTETFIGALSKVSDSGVLSKFEKLNPGFSELRNQVESNLAGTLDGITTIVGDFIGHGFNAVKDLSALHESMMAVASAQGNLMSTVSSRVGLLHTIAASPTILKESPAVQALIIGQSTAAQTAAESAARQQLAIAQMQQQKTQQQNSLGGQLQLLGVQQAKDLGGTLIKDALGNGISSLFGAGTSGLGGGKATYDIDEGQKVHVTNMGSGLSGNTKPGDTTQSPLDSLYSSVKSGINGAYNYVSSGISNAYNSVFGSNTPAATDTATPATTYALKALGNSATTAITSINTMGTEAQIAAAAHTANAAAATTNATAATTNATAMSTDSAAVEANAAAQTARGASSALSSAGSTLSGTGSGGPSLFQGLSNILGGGSYGVTNGAVPGNTFGVLASDADPASSGMMSGMKGMMGMAGSIFSIGTSIMSMASTVSNYISSNKMYDAVMAALPNHQSMTLPTDPSQLSTSAASSTDTNYQGLAGYLSSDKYQATVQSAATAAATGAVTAITNSPASYTNLAAKNPNQPANPVTTGAQQISSSTSSAAFQSSQQAPGVKILNVIDQSLVHDFMSTSGGEKVIMNALKNNASVIKQIIM